MNQKNLAKLKNYMKNLREILHYWSHKIVEKYAPLSGIGRFSAIATYRAGCRGLIKDPRIAKFQLSK